MMTTKVTTILLAPGPSKGIEQGVRKKKMEFVKAQSGKMKKSE